MAGLSSPSPGGSRPPGHSGQLGRNCGPSSSGPAHCSQEPRSASAAVPCRIHFRNNFFVPLTSTGEHPRPISGLIAPRRLSSSLNQVGPLRHDGQSKPLGDAVQHERRVVITQDGAPAFRVHSWTCLGQLCRDCHQMADWFAAGDSDGPAEALGVFTQAGGDRLDPRSFHGKVVLLDDGCPDGANVGVATQDRYEVGLTVPVRLRPPQ